MDTLHEADETKEDDDLLKPDANLLKLSMPSLATKDTRDLSEIISHSQPFPDKLGEPLPSHKARMERRRSSHEITSSLTGRHGVGSWYQALEAIENHAESSPRQGSFAPGVTPPVIKHGPRSRRNMDDLLLHHDSLDGEDCQDWASTSPTLSPKSDAHTPPPSMISSRSTTFRNLVPLPPTKSATKEAMRSLLMQKSMGHFLFEKVETEQREMLVDAMEEFVIEKGKILFEEHKASQTMVVIGEGIFLETKEGGGPRRPTAGNTFNEMALLRNVDCSSTLVCETEGRVFVLRRSDFTRIQENCAHNLRNKYIEFLSRVELFKILSEKQQLSQEINNSRNEYITQLAGLLVRKTFLAGEYIITKGGNDREFFLLLEGTVRVTTDDSTDAVLDSETCLEPGASSMPKQHEIAVVSCQSAHPYFGEMALLEDKPRAANVIAVPRDDADPTSTPATPAVVCLALNGDLFNEVMRQDVLEDLKHETKRRSTNLECAKQAVSIQGSKDTTSAPEVTPSASSPQGDVAIEEKPETENKGSSPPLSTAVTSGEPEKKYDLSVLKTLGTLGRGSFGEVQMVQTVDGEVLALKILSKEKMVRYKQQKQVFYEKQTLGLMNHPFTISLKATFSDQDSLYILTDVVMGGELRHLLYDDPDKDKWGGGKLCSDDRGMSEAHARFYTANIVLALGYLHDELGMVYRDLKPENLLVDTEGYLKVVDFGLSKSLPYLRNGEQADRCYTSCGTPDYISPEVILTQGHSFATDWWSLGIVVYEILQGDLPFYDDNNILRERKIKKANVVWYDERFEATEVETNEGLSRAKDLVGKLLHLTPELRLGSTQGGTKTLQDHPWFEGLGWAALLSKTIEAPYRPTVSSVTDGSNFKCDDDDAEPVNLFEGDDSLFKDF